MSSICTTPLKLSSPMQNRHEFLFFYHLDLTRPSATVDRQAHSKLKSQRKLADCPISRLNRCHTRLKSIEA